MTVSTDTCQHILLSCSIAHVTSRLSWTAVMLRLYPGPTFGMSWCSVKCARYSLNSRTFSLCDFSTCVFAFSTSFWIILSSYRFSAGVLLSSSSAGGGKRYPSDVSVTCCAPDGTSMRSVVFFRRFLTFFIFPPLMVSPPLSFKRPCDEDGI